MTEPILKLAPFYLCDSHKHKYKVVTNDKLDSRYADSNCQSFRIAE